MSCENCNNELTGNQRRWCSDACRKRTVRRDWTPPPQPEPERIEGRWYVLRRSFNYGETGWWCIVQRSNNVMIAEVPNWPIAKLIFDHLDTLKDAHRRQYRLNGQIAKP